MNIDMRKALLARIEQVAELPLILLSFAMVPLLAASLLWELNPETERIVVTLDVFIWAFFAAVLLAKLALAPDRWHYVKANWLDVALVLIPFIRPLRILRVIIYLWRGIQGATRMMKLDYLLVYAIGFVLVMATIVTTVETGSGSPLESFPNALWWAAVTATTVGYGDIVPATTMGRGAAILLMFGGIGLFGAVTANLASFLVRNDGSNAELERLVAEVRTLRSEVAALEPQRHSP